MLAALGAVAANSLSPWERVRVRASPRLLSRLSRGFAPIAVQTAPALSGRQSPFFGGRAGDPIDQPLLPLDGFLKVSVLFVEQQ